MALTDKAQENIVDISLDGIQRTKFRINGDPNSIIELNVTDLGIIDRLEKGVKQLTDKMNELTDLSSDDEGLTGKLQKIDGAMREIIDYIFDSPVSAVCARYGTMYDPKDGKFRYEIIIDGLTKLYKDNINEEYKKIQSRIKKHTSKYTVPTTSKSKKKGK